MSGVINPVISVTDELGGQRMLADSLHFCDYRINDCDLSPQALDSLDDIPALIISDLQKTVVISLYN